MSWSNTGERGWAYRGESPMPSEKDLTLEALLHERENLIRERDEARAKADTYERDWYEAKSEFGTATAKLREKVRTLEAALTTETRVSLDYQNQRDEVRKDFDSLEADAARVTLAYLHGDKIELDEAVYALMSNGRDKWWEAYKPVGLRGEDDD